MNKTFAKFQKNQKNIVGGIALTKYLLIASEMAKMTMVSKPYAQHQTMNKTSAKNKINKYRNKSVGGDALTKYPHIAFEQNEKK